MRLGRDVAPARPRAGWVGEWREGDRRAGTFPEPTRHVLSLVRRSIYRGRAERGCRCTLSAPAHPSSMPSYPKKIACRALAHLSVAPGRTVKTNIFMSI